MGFFLGIDIGTSATKAIVIDGDGRVVGSGTVEYPLYTPRPNWAEQDPEDWWKGTVGSTRRAIESAGISGDDISGIGFSGQMHGAVLLDSADRYSDQQYSGVTSAQRKSATRSLRRSARGASWS